MKKEKAWNPPEKEAFASSEAVSAVRVLERARGGAEKGSVLAEGEEALAPWASSTAVAFLPDEEDFAAVPPYEDAFEGDPAEAPLPEDENEPAAVLAGEDAGALAMAGKDGAHFHQAAEDAGEEGGFPAAASPAGHEGKGAFSHEAPADEEGDDTWAAVAVYRPQSTGEALERESAAVTLEAVPISSAPEETETARAASDDHELTLEAAPISSASEEMEAAMGSSDDHEPEDAPISSIPEEADDSLAPSDDHELEESLALAAPRLDDVLSAKLLSFDRNDEGNALRLKAIFGHVLFYSDGDRSWFYYNGARWVAASREIMGRWASAAVALTKDAVNQAYHKAAWARRYRVTKDGVIIGSKELEDERQDWLHFLLRTGNQGKTRDFLEKGKSLILKEKVAWDADPLLVNAPNGVIDLEAGDFRAHRPADYMRQMTAAAYDPAAASALWLHFLSEVLPHEDTRSWLQKYLGYALTASTKEEKLVFLCGPGGGGKSTLVETVLAAIGTYGDTVPIELFLAKNGHYRSGEEASPQTAKLADVRLVSAGESDSGRRLDEGFIKLVTGGDTITARNLYINSRTFRPTAKFLISTNVMPAVTNPDEKAIRRRIVIVPFNAVIKEADPSLKDRLRAPKVQRAVLAWMVEGAGLWQREGLGAPSEEMEEALQKFYGQPDDIGRFIQEACEEKPGVRTPLKVLHEAYQKWAEENGGHIWNRKDLSRLLCERGYVKIKTNQGVCFSRICLKES